MGERERQRRRESERQRMLHHEPSRHALHVNISRSASTEITTLCVCVCGNLVHSLLASRGGFYVLHSNQEKKTPYIISNTDTWSAFTSCVFSFHRSEFSSIYMSSSPSENAVRGPADLCWSLAATNINGAAGKVEVSPINGLSFSEYFRIINSKGQTTKVDLKSQQNNNLSTRHVGVFIILTVPLCGKTQTQQHLDNAL